MKKANTKKNLRPGFTLIEIIVTLIITSLMASLLLSYMSSAVSDAPQPVFRLDEHYQVTAVMEEISKEYHRLMRADSATAVSALNTSVTNGDFNVANGPTAASSWSSLDTVNFAGNSLLQVTVTMGDQSVSALFPSP